VIDEQGGRGGLRPLRVFRRWTLPLCVACALGAAEAGTAQGNAPSAGRVITVEAIVKSGARTAWDAVRLTVPNVQLREVRGEPARIQRRGRASIYQDDQVRVILDHLPVHDLRVLKQVAAYDILTIEVLTGLDATTRYGGATTTGVIVITTNSGRP
jgi:outer membrane receptor protein involved in Fe transport